MWGRSECLQEDVTTGTDLDDFCAFTFLLGVKELELSQELHAETSMGLEGFQASVTQF